MYSCMYCGSNLIYDDRTHSYVCPVCGIVYGYEMLPSHSHLSHVSPLDQVSGKLDREVAEKAIELFGSTIAVELSKLKGVKAREVMKALEMLVEKRNYNVSWKAIRKAVEIASKYKLKIDFDALREKRVRDEIHRFVEEHGLPVNPDDIWIFALRYRNLWAGRKARTIAEVFTYIYCRRKGINIENVKSRIIKLAQLIEKAINNEEEYHTT